MPHRGPWLARDCLGCRRRFQATAYRTDTGRVRSNTWYCRRCTQCIRNGNAVAPDGLSQIARAPDVAVMPGGLRKTTPTAYRFQLQAREEGEEWARRKALEEAAHRGEVWALVVLWRLLKVRYPLIEEKVGWKPQEARP